MITEIVYIGGGILLLAVIILSITLGVLQKKVVEIRDGTRDKEFGKNLRTLESFTETLEKKIATAEERMNGFDEKFTSTVRGVGIVRFNPFQESGGNQSFAMALVDEDGNGVVVSSLYVRERSSVYAKPLKKFESSFELTGEEKKAIDEARHHL